LPRIRVSRCCYYCTLSHRESQDEPVLEKFIRGHPFLGRKHPKDPCFFGNWNGAMDRDTGIDGNTERLGMKLEQGICDIVMMAYMVINQIEGRTRRNQSDGSGVLHLRLNRVSVYIDHTVFS
jgi:hypothetical protein